MSSPPPVTGNPVADPVPERPHYCALPPRPRTELRPGLVFERERAIRLLRAKWVSGTVLHYYFFDRDTDGSTVRLRDGGTRVVSWVGPEAQRKAVRDAFAEWKAVGIGLDFREVADRSDAEVRIGFDESDGSWSYVGKDGLDIGVDERTMNFGWDLTTSYGHTTALHEIGHTLGMPHEHQNPFAGIVWDEDAVYAYFAGDPNSWPRETTFHNVLRKLDQQEVEGSLWDPDSVMEYSFGPGLIAEPEAHRGGIQPPGTLSPADVAEARRWYPPLDDQETPELVPFQSRALRLAVGEQADFLLRPSASRKYRIGSFGDSDVAMVLFEVIDGEPRFLAGDDDGGEDRNALIEVKLFEGRTYLVRLRLYWSTTSGGTAVMYW